MKKFKVWADSAEQKTSYHQNWSEQEMINAYFAKDAAYPTTLGVFDTLEEAQELFNNTKPCSTHEEATNVGRVITFEVIGIDEEIVDENGEFVESGAYSDVKTEPLEYKEEEEEE